MTPAVWRNPSISTLAFLVAASAAHAEIDYRVTVKPTEKQLGVLITIPHQTGPVSVQIPNWMPGAYVYNNFYENVHEVTAIDGKGAALAVEHPDKNTWTVSPSAGGVVQFSYWIPTDGQRRFSQQTDASFIQISGAATYMYVLGRKNESCRVRFDVPNNWPVVTGLDGNGRGPNSYSAPSYDVLADNPVSTGQILIDQYNLRGKDHFIVLEGSAKSQVDRERLKKDCRFVSAAETDFFGNIPYHKYVWHFIVFPASDGAGGLEHLSSTQISLSSGEGPRAQSVLAHEFFHLWNVKRIRSKPLGPFDYLNLPRTGALWWLEGVTDYYANLLPYRYREWKQSQFFDSITSNVNAIRNNPAHLEVSANEASLKVADAAGGRGNSNGFRISYYNLGWLCGMCLDTEIRARTNNRRSLDDVIRALYIECKDNQPGFEEDEIRKLCIRFGGPELGPFYDKVVMQASDMPIEAQLAKMGLVMTESDQPYADVGFTAQPSRAEPGMRVGAVKPFVTNLQAGDTILAVNGTRIDGPDFRSNMRVIGETQTKAVAGAPITLLIKHGDQTSSITVTPQSATRKVRTVSVDPSASSSASALGQGWLKTKLPAVQ